MKQDDKICFQSCIITIIEDIAFRGISIYTNITSTHGFKQKAKELHIFPNSFRIYFKRSRGNRRVNKLAGHSPRQSANAMS